MKNAKFFSVILCAFLTCEIFAQNIEIKNDMLDNHNNVNFGSSFAVNKTLIDKYEFSHLSDNAKLIVFNQLVDLFFYPDRQFIPRLEDIQEEYRDSNNQSRMKSGENIKLYREGYLTGWVIIMKKFEERESAHLFTTVITNDVTAEGSISLLDVYNMEMFSPKSPCLLQGFIDGRSQASNLISHTIREIDTLTFEYLKNQGSSSLRINHLSDEEKKQILSKSPHYEAVAFLRKIIKDKMKEDKTVIDRIRSEVDSSVQTEESNAKTDQINADFGGL